MFQTILVAVDGSRSADMALDQAIDIARAMHARIEVLHVTVDPDFLFDTSVLAPREFRRRVTEHGHKVLNCAQDRLKQADIASNTTLRDDSVSPGHVAAVICSHADSISADLIVMGTHGLRGIRRLVLGSVAEGVIHQTGRPVLLVRSEMPG
ncbi:MULTISPECIES: universal stress protein [unclassified Cupriavidus]|uniref:universal stress protein n=1 Tax=unclassified Cupriavidus TaxID=2640874 RepID=UPI001C005033|nr:MULTISPECIES: universal stress protein [unclassified Cupriavidus]MCA3194127.1 universal stress protein [Cupriavidus sp.]MCA3199232.1 universal stress protein [Cupriavidus sp.]MCA3233831.1 universal stress protein [Cupriavidus sp.]QWE97148.1 universal stress protein [Cupriavidus sp. EM10]